MSITITASVTDVLSVIFSFLSVLLTGIYVLYTMKTFREIKKQTDNEVRAYMACAALISETKGSTDRIKPFREAYDNTITRILEGCQPSNQWLQIELQNRGKTDICQWKIHINFTIEVGGYLQDQHVTQHQGSFSIEYSGASDMIRPGNSIKIDIGNLGYIPKMRIEWRADYTDLHGLKSTFIGGDTSYEYINRLIFDYAPRAS